MPDGGAADGVRSIEHVRSKGGAARQSTGGGSTLDARRDLSGGDDQSRRRCSGSSAILLRRPRGAAAGGRVPRSRGKPFLRDGIWLGRVGQAVRLAAAGRAASVPRNQGADRAMPSPRRATCCSTSAPKRMDLCFELATQIMARLGDAVSPVDEVHGFRYFDDRDLLGFVDGTENPTGQAAIDATLIGEEDADVRRRQLCDRAEIPARSGRLERAATEAQERIIGRTKLSDIELDDAVKPTLGAQRADHDRRERQGDQDPARQHAVRQRRHRASSAPISSATAVRRARSSRCWKTCSSAARPAITIGCWISAAPSPAISSSCRPRHFWRTSGTARP